MSEGGIFLKYLFAILGKCLVHDNGGRKAILLVGCCMHVYMAKKAFQVPKLKKLCDMEIFIYWSLLFTLVQIDITECHCHLNL